MRALAWCSQKRRMPCGVSPCSARNSHDEAVTGDGDFLEHLVADLLDHVAFHHDDRRVVLAGAIEEAEIGADVVGELRPAARVDDLEAAGQRLVLAHRLHDHRSRGVAEDEMRLPVAEIEMAGDDLRRHHEHALLGAGAHQVEGDMQAGRRRRAAKPHVEGRTLRAERMLDLDGDRRIGPLVVRGGADHHVDVARLEPGMVERALGRRHAELGHDGELVIVARRNAWRHPRRGRECRPAPARGVP